MNFARPFDPSSSVPAGAVAGAPLLLLRAEGVAVAAISILLYSKLDAPWGLFAALILVPDLSMLGYLAGPRLGAAVYNAAHTLTIPIGLGLAGFLLPAFELIGIALVWTCHIGIDRALGFGLKYGTGFGVTHLGRLGNAAKP